MLRRVREVGLETLFQLSLQAMAEEWVEIGNHTVGHGGEVGNSILVKQQGTRLRLHHIGGNPMCAVFPFGSQILVRDGQKTLSRVREIGLP